ncbi:hypothetical protein MD484_g1838, partial [Candolleomyces efflorescens]
MVGIESENSNPPRPPSYTMTPEVPYANRHPDYYEARGNLTIQIEETYFKISDIKFWTHSREFFKLVARENGTTLEDVDDEKAKEPLNAAARIWKLRDVEAKDFRASALGAVPYVGLIFILRIPPTNRIRHSQRSREVQGKLY